MQDFSNATIICNCLLFMLFWGHWEMKTVKCLVSVDIKRSFWGIFYGYTTNTQYLPRESRYCRKVYASSATSNAFSHFLHLVQAVIIAPKFSEKICFFFIKKNTPLWSLWDSATHLFLREGSLKKFSEKIFCSLHEFKVILSPVGPLHH